MVTITSYPDLEKCRKLAKFLSRETADMEWINDGLGEPFPIPVERVNDDEEPCWSLAALLSVLEHPRCFQGDKPMYWFCGCFGKDKLYHEMEADNPVDACVNMIIELNKLNLL